jgi:Nucleoside 2-deoxyribosyltransferase like
MRQSIMARVLKPPAPIDLAPGERSVFLAGSIDMGRAEDWQSALTRGLAASEVVILNPRRDAWDATWEQDIAFAPFREQVEWELDGLERATVIAMHFSATSQAPVTLLEFGLFAQSGRVVVCCPPEYWRRGNVEIVCRRYGVVMQPDLQALAAEVRRRVA